MSQDASLIMPEKNLLPSRIYTLMCKHMRGRRTSMQTCLLERGLENQSRCEDWTGWNLLPLSKHSADMSATEILPKCKNRNVQSYMHSGDYQRFAISAVPMTRAPALMMMMTTMTMTRPSAMPQS